MTRAAVRACLQPDRRVDIEVSGSKAIDPNAAPVAKPAPAAKPAMKPKAKAATKGKARAKAKAKPAE